MKTIKALELAAKAIVEICDLSPHSPRKVKVNACQNTNFAATCSIWVTQFFAI